MSKEKNVFVQMVEQARNEKEREYFEQMISMMLCTRKYMRIKELS